MKQFWFQLLLIMTVIVGALIYARQTGFISYLQTYETKKLKIDQAELTVDIADTPEKRAKGLGGRTSLDQNSGMLFLFDTKAKHRFWMKGMKIPLDFIWIKDDKVADVIINVQPPSADQTDDTLPVYEPIEPVDKVLEVQAGFVTSKNIRIGDKVEISD